MTAGRDGPYLEARIGKRGLRSGLRAPHHIRHRDRRRPRRHHQVHRTARRHTRPRPRRLTDDIPRWHRGMTAGRDGPHCQTRRSNGPLSRRLRASHHIGDNFGPYCWQREGGEQQTHQDHDLKKLYQPTMDLTGSFKFPDILKLLLFGVHAQCLLGVEASETSLSEGWKTRTSLPGNLPSDKKLWKQPSRTPLSFQCTFVSPFL